MEKRVREEKTSAERIRKMSFSELLDLKLDLPRGVYKTKRDDTYNQIINDEIDKRLNGIAKKLTRQKVTSSVQNKRPLSPEEISSIFSTLKSKKFYGKTRFHLENGNVTFWEATQSFLGGSPVNEETIVVFPQDLISGVGI